MLSAVTCGQMPPPSEIPPPSPASSPAIATEERSAPPQKIFSNLVSIAIVSVAIVSIAIVSIVIVSREYLLEPNRRQG